MILPSSILPSNSVPLTWNGCPSNGGDFETGIFTCFLIPTLYFSFSSSLPKYFARAFFLSSCSCFYNLHKCSACSSMSQDSCSMYRWLVRRRAMSACFLADHSSALSQYVDMNLFFLRRFLTWQIIVTLQRTAYPIVFHHIVLSNTLVPYFVQALNYQPMWLSR